MAQREGGEHNTIDRLGCFQLANTLAENGSLLKRLREKLGISKVEFASQAKISIQRLSAYERPGPIAGDFWSFCRDLSNISIDPRLGDAPEYLERFLKPDPQAPFKGGSKRRRDKWFEWSSKEFRPFRDWVHREKLKELPDGERGKPLTRPRIKQWWDEWEKLSRRKQSAYEVIRLLK